MCKWFRGLCRPTKPRHVIDHSKAHHSTYACTYESSATAVEEGLQLSTCESTAVDEGKLRELAPSAAAHPVDCAPPLNRPVVAANKMGRRSSRSWRSGFFVLDDALRDIDESHLSDDDDDDWGHFALR